MNLIEIWALIQIIGSIIGVITLIGFLIYELINNKKF